MDISKRMSSGMVSNARDTGSTVGSRIAKTSRSDVGDAAVLAQAVQGQDAQADEREDEDRHRNASPPASSVSAAKL